MIPRRSATDCNCGVSEEELQAHDSDMALLTHAICNETSFVTVLYPFAQRVPLSLFL